MQGRRVRPRQSMSRGGWPGAASGPQVRPARGLQLVTCVRRLRCSPCNARTPACTRACACTHVLMHITHTHKMRRPGCSPRIGVSCDSCACTHSCLHTNKRMHARTHAYITHTERLRSCRHWGLRPRKRLIRSRPRSHVSGVLSSAPTAVCSSVSVTQCSSSSTSVGNLVATQAACCTTQNVLNALLHTLVR